MRKSQLLLCLPLFIISCTIAKPGTIYVKQRLGKLDPATKTDGLIIVNPLTTVLIDLPTRTTSGELTEVFKKYGPLKDVYIPQHAKGELRQLKKKRRNGI